MPRRAAGATDARRAVVRSMTEAGASVGEIVADLQRRGIKANPAAVAYDRRILGIKSKKRGADKAAAAKAERAERAADAVRDRRRFKVVPVPFGRPSMVAPASVQTTGRTMFPSRVFQPSDAEAVLKDGAGTAKIGGDVLVGRLRGARILTLTLEERATCPRSCTLWGACYGNSMPWARRWRPGPDLEAQIAAEAEAACAAHGLVLVRLHVLGDFYSFDYLRLWAGLLDDLPGLHVFGFTAWQPGTRIGDGIARLRAVYPDRFMLRVSGATGQWGSFTLPFPTEAKQIGDAIVCPEQLDAMQGSPRGKHCGNCAICWSTARPVAFVQH